MPRGGGERRCALQYGRSRRSGIVTEPIDYARNRLCGWLVGVLFPVANGNDIHAEELRQIGLKQVEFNAAPLYMLPDGSWL